MPWRLQVGSFLGGSASGKARSETLSGWSDSGECRPTSAGPVRGSETSGARSGFPVFSCAAPSSPPVPPPQGHRIIEDEESSPKGTEWRKATRMPGSSAASRSWCRGGQQEKGGKAESLHCRGLPAQERRQGTNRAPGVPEVPPTDSSSGPGGLPLLVIEVSGRESVGHHR